MCAGVGTPTRSGRLRSRRTSAPSRRSCRSFAVVTAASWGVIVVESCAPCTTACAWVGPALPPPGEGLLPGVGEPDCGTPPIDAPAPEPPPAGDPDDCCGAFWS